MTVTNVDNQHFFTQLSLSYYPTDDFKLSGGFDYLNQTGMGTAGVEYLMHNGLGTPVSLFAKARFGASDYQQITAGVRVHFGADPKASLIARDRTADPPNYTPVWPKLTTAAAGSSPSAPEVCEADSSYGPSDTCTCPYDTEPLEGGGYYCTDVPAE